MGDGTQSTPGTGTAAESLRRLARRSAAPTDAERDLQGLVARALERLAAETGCARGAVWWRTGSGQPAVIAAVGEPGGAGEAGPEAETIDALLALEGPVDLAERALPEALGRLGRSTGLAAAAPVRGPDGDGLAALLLGGPDDPAGAVRPRTLAAADATARRLATPFAAAQGAARLAELDVAVERLDRLAALGELVSEIVHEIRNPLVSVKTFLQLLPERSGDPEFTEQFHEIATEELRRVERLLDLVLAQGRPVATDRPDPGGSVGEAIASVTQLVSHRAAQAHVTVDPGEPDPELRAALGGDALRQVVLNLVLNALDASPDGGTVRVRASRNEGGVEVRVEDDGPGVAAELRERVFEPFFSTRRGSPGGLGLAISRRLAERAGGRLEVTGDHGGCFRLWIPN